MAQYKPGICSCNSRILGSLDSEGPSVSTLIGGINSPDIFMFQFENLKHKLLGPVIFPPPLCVILCFLKLLAR